MKPFLSLSGTAAVCVAGFSRLSFDSSCRFEKRPGEEGGREGGILGTDLSSTSSQRERERESASTYQLSGEKGGGEKAEWEARPTLFPPPSFSDCIFVPNKSARCCTKSCAKTDKIILYRILVNIRGYNFQKIATRFDDNECCRIAHHEL